MELITCWDCKRSISFTATNCPYCGSREPSGPYQASRRELKGHRIEQRNDRTVFVTFVVVGLIGAIWGYFASPDGYNPTIVSVVGGVVGVFLGLLIAFMINLIRTAKHRLFR
jgi:hypothetical protein